MKDFKHWGIKVRKYPEKNYHAIWCNLETIRIGKGQALELEPDHAEFYDVSLGTKCNLECPFCYTNAKHSGRIYYDILEKAELFFGQMSDNQKPFQIAIGSEGEPTIHPQFLPFLELIHGMGIVPNYTTNGITLSKDDKYSKQLLECTEKYCGGVAVSANTWNPEINEAWQVAVQRLACHDININIHYIINDKKSVDDFVEIYNKYKSVVKNFVLLPLMQSGRSLQKYTEDAFEYLLSKELDMSTIAFGAHFYELLQQNQDKIKCWLYPPESLSKNLILDDVIKITASSFCKQPLIEINYATNTCDI